MTQKFHIEYAVALLDIISNMRVKETNPCIPVIILGDVCAEEKSTYYVDEDEDPDENSLFMVIQM